MILLSAPAPLKLVLKANFCLGRKPERGKAVYFCFISPKVLPSHLNFAFDFVSLLPRRKQQRVPRPSMVISLASSSWSAEYHRKQRGFSTLYLCIDDVLRLLYWVLRLRRTPPQRQTMTELFEKARSSFGRKTVVPLTRIGVTWDDAVSFLGDARLGPGPYSYELCKLREHYFKLPKDFLGGGEVFLYSVEMIAVPSAPVQVPDLSHLGTIKLLRPFAEGEAHGDIVDGYWRNCPEDATVVENTEAIAGLGDSLSLFDSKVSKRRTVHD